MRSAPSKSSERTPVAVTRPPARATVRMSVPSPSAAIAITVSRLVATVMGLSSMCGRRAAQRRAISARKPQMKANPCSGSSSRVFNGRRRRSSV